MRLLRIPIKVSYRATNINATSIIGISETPTFGRRRNILLIIINNINNIRLITYIHIHCDFLNVSDKHSK